MIISSQSVVNLSPDVSLTAALTLVTPDGRSGNPTEAKEPATVEWDYTSIDSMSLQSRMKR